MKQTVKKAVAVIFMAVMILQEGSVCLAAVSTPGKLETTTRYVDGTGTAGTVNVQLMETNDYEGCGYYPADALFRIRWDGLCYKPCRDKSFAEEMGAAGNSQALSAMEALQGGDNYARMCCEAPEIRLTMLRVLRDAVMGEASSKTGNMVFENIRADEINRYHYLVSFSISSLEEHDSLLWNDYAKNYALLPKLQIDAEAPSLALSLLPQNETNGYCQSVTAIMVASDQTTGLSKTPFSWDQGVTWTSEVSHSFAQNGSYSAWVKDKVGNIAKSDFTITAIDQEAPEIQSLSQTLSRNVNGYSDRVLLKAEARDQQLGMSEIPFSWDEGKTWTTENTRVVTENGNYSVTARDLLKNQSVAACQVTAIDSEGPRMVSANTVIPERYGAYGLSARIELQAEDMQAGLDSAPYSWDRGETWTADSRQNFYQNQEADVWIRDGLSNITKERVTVSCIDHEAPVIREAVVSSPNAVNGYVTEAKIVVNAEDAGAGLARLPYSYDGGVTWGQEANHSCLTNETVRLKVRDGLLNQSEKELKVGCIDREGPVIQEITSELPDSAGGYGKEVLLHIVASDDKSGLSAASYSYDNGKTWVSSNRKSISQNGMIAAAVRDGLGNVTKKTVLVDRIDKNPPRISITGNPESDVYSDVILTVTASDEQSGIAGIWYQNDEIQAKKLLGEYQRESCVKERVSIATNGTYRFFVYDKTGNREEAVVHVTKIKRRHSEEEPKKSSSSSSKKTSSSSSKRETVTENPIVTTIIEKENQSTTTKQSPVVLEEEKKTVSNNKLGSGGKTKVVKSAGSSSGKKNKKKSSVKTGPSQDWGEEMTESEILEGELEENLAEPVVIGKAEIQYPEEKEKGVDTGKIILVAVGIGLFLLVLTFVLLYRTGLFSKDEEEKESERKF